MHPSDLEGGPERGELLEGRGGAEFRAALDRTPSALDAVRPFGRLTTPAFAPVRYRTRFVQVDLPAGQEPVVVEGELVEGRFVDPVALIEEWKQGGLLVAPPVLYLLELAAKAESLEAFLAEAEVQTASHEAGRLHRIRNTPGAWMAPLETPTLPPATTTNTYIVGGDRLMVIDPGTPFEGERERLFAFLDEMTEEGREIAGVLPTHHHPDHVGSVHEVAERYDVPMIAHPITLERLAPKNPQSIEDGQSIDLGIAPDGTAEWQLTAHHTPGHDRGHLVWIESRYHAAFAGDLCSTVSTIVIDPPEGHLATYLETLRRMLKVEMGVLYPAHGPAHREGHRLIEHYLKHRGEREEKLVTALAESRSEAELVERVYDDVKIPAVLPLAARSLRAGLEKLQEEGRAAESSGLWSLA